MGRQRGPGSRRNPSAPPHGRRSPRRSRLTLGILALASVAAGWWLWSGGWIGAETDHGVEPQRASPVASGGGGESGAAEAGEARPEAEVRRLRVEVVERYPHDPEAFTQGLLLHAGELYESTGRYGHSRLRRVELASGRVLAERRLPPDWFGEGLARVPGDAGSDDRLLQLTWLEGVAPVWRLDGLERDGEHRYHGEGWGLCHDDTVIGGRLVMSDGSDRLTFRDPTSFAELGAVQVALHGRPVRLLNELECVDGRVLANLLGGEQIVEIDPATGRVTAVIDASGLLAPAERPGTDVLNGIAHDPADGTLLLTGKLWPWVFRVEVVAD